MSPVVPVPALVLVPLVVPVVVVPSGSPVLVLVPLPVPVIASPVEVALPSAPVVVGVPVPEDRSSEVAPVVLVVGSTAVVVLDPLDSSPKAGFCLTHATATTALTTNRVPRRTRYFPAEIESANFLNAGSHTSSVCAGPVALKNTGSPTPSTMTPSSREFGSL